MLKENNYDFDKATEIFTNLTDVQRIWLSVVMREQRRPSDMKSRLSATRNRVYSKRRR